MDLLHIEYPHDHTVTQWSEYLVCIPEVQGVRTNCGLKFFEL